MNKNSYPQVSRGTLLFICLNSKLTVYIRKNIHRICEFKYYIQDVSRET